MRLKIFVALALLLSVVLVACEPQVVEVEVEVTREVEVEVETEVEVEVEVTREVETIVEKEVVVEEIIETTVEVLALPAVDPTTLSGDIVIAGSSTVFPLAERMIEVINSEGYPDSITYDSIGSGGGFERFCVNGETDISGASRGIRDSEIESCEAIGRSPIEFRVGTDALAVVVSSENDFATDVTLEELAAIFSTATTWADVRSDWPAENILRYIPGTDSGTFDYFVEEVFEENVDPILAASNTELSEDDNVLVQGIQSSPYAIGFFGFAYYQENAGSLNILALDGQAANQANVDAATYPLARPLYIYSDAGIMAEKPQVASFISYFLSNVNNEIGDVGYFPAGVADLNAAKQAWADAAGMAGDMMMDMGMFGLAPVDPTTLSGDIVIAGSSTVFPLAERMIEVINSEGYPDSITYDSIGSGGGFERFCVNGETDISGASRGIRDSEIESCEAIGRTPIEFRIGTDALAVVVSSENDFATDVTLEELAAIFSTATTWADVRADWPAENILRYIPGTDSGTFDYFVEEVFDENVDPILAAANTELSEDDNVLVQGIQSSPYAIGFFGFAYYQENAGSLNILALDGIAANQENVDAAAYPLARPLYMYSDAGIIAEKPQVGSFLSYVLQNVNNEIGDVGYFPANDSVLEGAAGALQGAMSGEMMMDDSSGMLAPVDPTTLSGDIVIAGSSTVFPLAERMIEVINSEGYPDSITYDSIGSGGGFERFCVNGETDISGASRGIRDSEIESCEAIGRTPIEFRIGTDALAVVVSAENDFATDVTLEELAAIFSTATTWADVRADWPAENILRYIPGTDSGTFDYFVEEVFEENVDPILAASNTELSEDDNVLVQGIQSSPYAIGFFGFAYYQENAGSLNILALDGIAANQENVDAAAYPLARPLYMYSDAGIIAEKPQVGSFLSYVLQNVNREIGDVGYFPANDAVLGEAMSALAEAMDQ